MAMETAPQQYQESQSLEIQHSEIVESFPLPPPKELPPPPMLVAIPPPPPPLFHNSRNHPMSRQSHCQSDILNAGFPQQYGVTESGGYHPPWNTPGPPPPTRGVQVGAQVGNSSLQSNEYLGSSRNDRVSGQKRSLQANRQQSEQLDIKRGKYSDNARNTLMIPSQESKKIRNENNKVGRKASSSQSESSSNIGKLENRVSDNKGKKALKYTEVDKNKNLQKTEGSQKATTPSKVDIREYKPQEQGQEPILAKKAIDSLISTYNQIHGLN